ncbi:MAG: hypothetical protein GAK40_01467 [Burkholderia plantarii]|nr:MAG: hypothetical protein GAK40_01467 [Burkholderia plantarii]
MPQNARRVTIERHDGLTASPLVLRFLARQDVVALGRRQAFLLLRRFVEHEPEHAPDHAEHADHDERDAPVRVQDAPDHERRCHQRADRRADVEPARGDRALLGREPFGGGLQAGRDAGRFRQAQQAAHGGQADPAVRDAVQHAGGRPGHRENREAELGAEHVEHVAGDRLHHRVGGLKRGDDIRVLLRRDIEHLVDFGGGHRKRIAGEVVDDEAHRDEGDHPPAHAFDRFHLNRVSGGANGRRGARVSRFLVRRRMT